MVNRFLRVHYIFLAIALLYLMGFLGHAWIVQKTVYGDGIYYYSWLRSVMIDGDLFFRNDYDLLGVTQLPTSTGMLANIYPIGPAILWSASFNWVHSIVQGNGTSLFYQLTTGATSVGYALVGLLLMYHFFRRHYSELASILSVTSIAFATNLFFYGSLDTVNSHAVSFAIAALFVNLWMQKNTNDVLMGTIVGLLALIRPQDAVYGLLLLAGATTKSLVRNALGFFLVFSLQLTAWQILYGKFWISPYLDRGYGFDFFRPNILQTLFSPLNGLFLWTPLTLLGVLGYFFPKIPKIEHKPYLLCVLFLQLYLIASWTNWWQGESYSGRMFISSLPIIGLGLAHFFNYFTVRKWAWQILFLVCVGPLSFLNMMLITFFLFTH